MEETKKSKVNFIIYIIVCVVVAISSFFMGYQYGKNPQTINSQISSSYAVGDSTTGTFTSSNFYVPMKYCSNGNLNGYSAFDYEGDTVGFSLRFSLTYNQNSNDYTFGLIDNTYINGDYNLGTANYIYWGLSNVSLVNNLPYYKVLDNTNPTFYLKGFNSGTSNGFMFIVNIENGFDTLNVLGVNITKQTQIENFIEYEAYVEDNEIYHSFGLIEFAYFDNNGKRFTISCCGALNSTLNTFVERTYYFAGDTNAYDYGYSIGYQEGESAGATSGYSNGYSTGYDIGRQVGYNEGVINSNDYTFLGLFSAVVDAPITIFKGLFNFSIFGTNMGQFLLSLASITLVIVIVRFVLARKE